MRSIIFISLCFFMGIPAFAAGEATRTHALMTTEEQELNRRARQKLFPGGKDEDPLKVQGQLPTITRKMGPSTEAPEEEHAADQPTD